MTVGPVVTVVQLPRTAAHVYDTAASTVLQRNLTSVDGFDSPEGCGTAVASSIVGVINGGVTAFVGGDNAPSPLNEIACAVKR